MHATRDPGVPQAMDTSRDPVRLQEQRSNPTTSKERELDVVAFVPLLRIPKIVFERVQPIV